MWSIEDKSKSVVQLVAKDSYFNWGVGWVECRVYHQCEALIRSAAFSATPYSVADKCALICNGMIEASTTRTFAVS